MHGLETWHFLMKPVVMKPVEPFRLARLVLILICASTFGCFGGSDGSSRVKEIVDVQDLPNVDTSNDPQEVARKPTLVGVLPKSFPTDLALYLPASLVDFRSSGGSHSVDLLSPHSPSKVQPELIALLRGKGWVVEDVGSGASSLRKGTRQVRLKFGSGEPGTVYRFEY